MIFDSLGIGELGLIAVVAVLFLDPRKVGQAGRAFARLRQKWSKIQREVRQQIHAVVDDNPEETAADIRAAKATLRREARDAIRTLPAIERVEAAEKILSRLRELPAFQRAKAVASFAGTHEEIDTDGINRELLAAGKILLLPYVATDADGNSRMALARVENCDRDLQEGVFGVREPREDLRAADAPHPDLILVPGLAFDERGGRLGRGRGYYDRYLPGCSAYKLGLAFDAQVLRKKLALEQHDQLLDGLCTERRTLMFSLPSASVSGGKASV